MTSSRQASAIWGPKNSRFPVNTVPSVPLRFEAFIREDFPFSAILRYFGALISLLDPKGRRVYLQLCGPIY